jgi:hypothetical protein
MSDLSRRSLVATAAALPALAGATTFTLTRARGSEPDPIFAVIEKCRAIDAAFDTRCLYEEDLEEADIKLEPAPDDHRTPEIVALVNASIAARREFANTAPTTLPGLIAYLDFVIAATQRLSGEEVVFFFDDDEEKLAFIHSVARGVRTLTPAEPSA